MRGVYMTASGVKFIPALLAKTLSRCQSRALNEACVRVMAFIVETVPEEALLPSHFIPVLSKMMKEYIFLLAVTRGGLSILLAFYDHCGQEAMAYLGAEDTVTALQYIYYATQSQECREKAHTLLTALHAPLQVSADLPLRSDALEDILFAGMVQQLDAKDGKVLLETLEVCREAMTLSQPRFLHAFEAKKGLGKLLGVLRPVHGGRGGEAPGAGAAAHRGGRQDALGDGGGAPRHDGVPRAAAQRAVPQVREVPHLPASPPQRVQ